MIKLWTKLWPVLIVTLLGCKASLPPAPPQFKPQAAKAPQIKRRAQIEGHGFAVAPAQTNFTLSMALSNGQPILSWTNATPCIQIYTALTPQGPWTSYGSPLIGQSKTLPLDASAKFFRVKQGVILDLSVTGQPPTITFQLPEVGMPETGIDHTTILRSQDGVTNWTQVATAVGNAQTAQDTSLGNNPANTPMKTLFYKGESITTPNSLTAQHKIGWVSALAPGGVLWAMKIGALDYQDTATCISTRNGFISVGGKQDPFGVFPSASLVNLTGPNNITWNAAQTSSGGYGDAVIAATVNTPDGAVVSVGAFRNEVNFDRTYPPTLPPMNGTGYGGIFISKVQPNGICNWQNAINYTNGGVIFPFDGVVFGYDVAYSPLDDTVVMVLCCMGTFTINTEPPTTFTSLGGGGQTAAIAVVKYNHTTGVAIWAKMFTSADSGNSYPGYVEVDEATGRIYFGGGIKGTIDFGAPAGPLVTDQSGQKKFTACLDSSGNGVWSIVTDGGGTAGSSGVAPVGHFMALSESRVFVSGLFSGTKTFGPFQKTSNGSYNVYLYGINKATGVIEFCTTWGNAATYGRSPKLKCSRTNGGLFAGANFDGDLNLGGSSTNMTGGYQTGYVARFNTDGVCQWNVPFTGQSAVTGIAVDESLGGMPIVAGYFTGDVSIGRIPLSTRADRYDWYIARLMR